MGSAAAPVGSLPQADLCPTVYRPRNPQATSYSHIIPPETTSDDLLAATPYDGRLVVAHDLMMITVGEEIVVAERPRLEDVSFEKSRVLR